MNFQTGAHNPEIPPLKNLIFGEKSKSRSENLELHKINEEKNDGTLFY